jgi:hypothetical protein
MSAMSSTTLTAIMCSTESACTSAGTWLRPGRGEASNDDQMDACSKLMKRDAQIPMMHEDA